MLSKMTYFPLFYSSDLNAGVFDTCFSASSKLSTVSTVILKKKKNPNMAKHHQSSLHFSFKNTVFSYKVFLSNCGNLKNMARYEKTKIPIIPPLREQQWFIEFLSCFFYEGMYCHMLEVILYLYPVLMEHCMVSSSDAIKKPSETSVLTTAYCDTIRTDHNVIIMGHLG